MGKLIQPFYLQRNEDVSGVSGTGIVAVGVVLPSGQAILEWQTQYHSLGIYDSLEALERIHGHDGATKVIMGIIPNEKTK